MASKHTKAWSARVPGMIICKWNVEIPTIIAFRPSIVGSLHARITVLRINLAGNGAVLGVMRVKQTPCICDSCYLSPSSCANLWNWFAKLSPTSSVWGNLALQIYVHIRISIIIMVLSCSFLQHTNKEAGTARGCCHKMRMKCALEPTRELSLRPFWVGTIVETRWNSIIDVSQQIEINRLHIQLLLPLNHPQKTSSAADSLVDW